MPFQAPVRFQAMRPPAKMSGIGWKAVVGAPVEALHLSNGAQGSRGLLSGFIPEGSG